MISYSSRRCLINLKTQSSRGSSKLSRQHWRWLCSARRIETMASWKNPNLRLNCLQRMWDSVEAGVQRVCNRKRSNSNYQGKRENSKRRKMRNHLKRREKFKSKISKRRKRKKSQWRRLSRKSSCNNNSNNLLKRLLFLRINKLCCRLLESQEDNRRISNCKHNSSSNEILHRKWS